MNNILLAIEARAVFYAVECWKRIIENLEEEWGIIEGTPIIEAEQEIQSFKKWNSGRK